MTTFTLYWVAFIKHDQPQHLVAGPFFDHETANEDAFLRTHAGARYEVVSCEQQFKNVF